MSDGQRVSAAQVAADLQQTRTEVADLRDQVAELSAALARQLERHRRRQATTK